jgi:hypothetical protein
MSTGARKSKAKAIPDKVRIRSWPKMVFLWPTAVVCLILGCLSVWLGEAEWGGTLGWFFVGTLGFNLLVLTFDFPRATSLTLVAVIALVIVGAILLNQQYEFISPLSNFLEARDITASTELYFSLFTIMAILYIGMFMVTRFDYWVLTSNELIHHRGLLGDVERFSTAGLRLNKEISDVFEYILAGAGTVVFNIPGRPRPIVLENVPWIGWVERTSDLVLNARTVRVARDDGEEFTDAERRVQAEAEEAGG